jgi:hypothetical protein
MSNSPPKVEVVVPLDFSPFGACLFRSPHLYFTYEGNREEDLGAKKARTSVIDSERYYVQQQEVQAFLVRELAAPSQEPAEEDRIVRVFLDREIAYHFADAANDLQRKLDAHTATPWNVRAVTDPPAEGTSFARTVGSIFPGTTLEKRDGPWR